MTITVCGHHRPGQPTTNSFLGSQLVAQILRTYNGSGITYKSPFRRMGTFPQTTKLVHPRTLYAVSCYGEGHRFLLGVCRKGVTYKGEDWWYRNGYKSRTSITAAPLLQFAGLRASALWRVAKWLEVKGIIEVEFGNAFHAVPAHIDRHTTRFARDQVLSSLSSRQSWNVVLIIIFFMLRLSMSGNVTLKRRSTVHL